MDNQLLGSVGGDVSWKISCLEIMRIKNHELMFLKYHLERNFVPRNIFMQNQLNIWFGLCLLILYCLLRYNSESWAHDS